MGDLFWDLGEIQNAGELIAAKVVGATIGFKHGAQLEVPLKAEVIRNDPLEVSTNGGIQEVREIELVIPAQPPAYSGVRIQWRDRRVGRVWCHAVHNDG